MTMKSLDSHGSAPMIRAWHRPDHAGIINFSRTGTPLSTARSRHTETAFSGALFSHIAARECGIVRAWMQPQAHQRRFLTRKSEGEKRDGSRARGRELANYANCAGIARFLFSRPADDQSWEIWIESKSLGLGISGFEYGHAIEKTES